MPRVACNDAGVLPHCTTQVDRSATNCRMQRRSSRWKDGTHERTHQAVVSVTDRWAGRDKDDRPPGLRFEVRWRSEGKQRKQRFDTKQRAVLFDAEKKLKPDAVGKRSTYTVGQMCEAWLATVAVRESTMKAYRLEVSHINQAFGGRLASSIKPSEVRTWLARTKPGVSIRKRCLISLRRAYKLAILDGLVERDPTVGATPPRQPKVDPQYLSWEALAHLASLAGEDAPLIWLLGTGGLRLEEALGLDQGDIDRARGRVRVRKSKTDAGVREVPIDPDVIALLPTWPGPVFKGVNGGRLNGHNWRERRFSVIREAAGLSPAFTPHKLRHTAASLAIATGADVKSVQRMLGHASAAMTLDRYSSLFDAHLDEVSQRMGDARRLVLGQTPLTIDPINIARTSPTTK